MRVVSSRPITSIKLQFCSSNNLPVRRCPQPACWTSSSLPLNPRDNNDLLIRSGASVRISCRWLRRDDEARRTVTRVPSKRKTTRHAGSGVRPRRNESQEWPATGTTQAPPNPPVSRVLPGAFAIHRRRSPSRPRFIRSDTVSRIPVNDGRLREFSARQRRHRTLKAGRPVPLSRYQASLSGPWADLRLGGLCPGPMGSLRRRPTHHWNTACGGDSGACEGNSSACDAGE